MVRRYYSQRVSGSKNQISLNQLRDVFRIIFRKYYHAKYFCEKLEIGCCVDMDDSDVSPVMIMELRNDLWPLEDWYERDGKLEDCTKNELFDLVEFFYDKISKPVETKNLYLHEWNGCGYHYEKYSEGEGQKEYRKDINDMLGDFGDGFELSITGEICRIPDAGVSKILKAKTPETADENIKNRIIHAQELFYKGRSTIADRRTAVKELADCFEFLKSDIKKALDSKDENDLFNIANNFGIRHNNKKQKTNYDENIWLSWMVHFYLATLHASLRLIEKAKKNDKNS